jgi:hypothetical protein
MAGQPFTVTQNGAPFLIASNKTLNCNASWNFDPPVLSGNCGTPGSTVAVVSTMTNFGCGRAYIATRVWNATDACANQVFATQVVTVVAGPPQLTSAPNKSVECNSGWTFDVPTAAEFCGGTNVTIRVPAADTIFTNGMCGNTKIITRTWEVTDSCNNTSLVSQTVFVVDTTPPVPIFSPGKTVECGSVWSFDRPTGVDGCNGTNVTVSVVSTLTNLTGSCGYTATRVWQLLDPCLNSSTCTQVVTAVDSTPPLLTCGSNKTVECGSGWSFNEPTVTDNCSDSNALTVLIIETVTNNAGFCGNTFVATRTWVAEDACGNLAFCSQTVQVVDTTPPVVLCASNKTSEYGQPWDFDLPTGTDGCGGTNLTIRIVSTATNTSGSCGATFTATRMWEVSDACSNKVNCAQMVTVRDTTPPAIACAADKAINCLGTWSFDFPTATDIASGTNVSVVPISTVTNGICGTDFTATRTWRATDSCGNSSICSQTVFGRAIVTVSGTVFCPTNYPPTMSDKRVPGARLIGPTNTIATSISDGTYNLAFDAVSNVTINTLAPITNPADGADGVTTLDISLVRRHILNIVSLDSPYKLLAADVDGNKAVSTLDLSFMRRLVLDPTNRPPAGLWRFIPSNYIFTNTLAPWSAPTNRSYPGVSADLGGQDFLAIKLGDVNNSVKSSVSAGVVQTLKKNLTPVVTFQVNNAASAPGTSVVVRVTVSNFSRVTTAQGTLTWNPAVLRFVATEQYGLGGLASGNFGKVLAPNGTLTFSWDDPTVQGVTVADDTAIFALRFDVIGSPGSASPVALVDSVTICEASVDLVACTFRALSGQVSVVDSNGLRLSAAPIANSTFGVGVPTVVGKSYILEYTDSLPATDWIPLPAVPGDGTIKILSDPSPKTQQRFYRLRVE